ncbi:hypothetical protein EBI01_01210 [Marinomonas rhizomae]|nr:hypothetical protein EBI01_01210 [Marinomonas rhizomae]
MRKSTMQIANYGKRFIQYLLYGYLQQLQKSTKMLQKKHSPQNSAFPSYFCPIVVHKNKCSSLKSLVFSSFNKKIYSAKLNSTLIFICSKSVKTKHITHLS